MASNWFFSQLLEAAGVAAKAHGSSSSSYRVEASLLLFSHTSMLSSQCSSRARLLLLLSHRSLDAAKVHCKLLLWLSYILLV
jgi:hypothetical protein